MAHGQKGKLFEPVIWKNAPLRMANSFMVYTTCSMLVYFLHDLTAGFYSKLLGYKPVFFYHRLFLPSRTEDWSQLTIFMTFSAPAITFFFLGVWFFFLFYLNKKSPKIIRLYLFWGSLLCINMLLGNLLLSMFEYNGMAVTYAWLYLPKTFNTVTGLLGTLALIIIGVSLNRHILQLAPSTSLEVNKYPKQFALQILVIPQIAGFLFMILVYIPLNTWVDFWLQMGMTILVSSAFVFARPIKELKLPKSFQIQHFNFFVLLGFIFMTLMVLIFKYVSWRL